MGRAIDALGRGRNEAMGMTGSAISATIDCQPFAELSDRDGKWPRQFRIVFVAGSAVTIWSLVYFGLKYL